MTEGGASLTPLQADLLRATFGADEAAVAAWRRWRDAIDWEAHLDHDAFRLLPRTYGNLRRHDVADPLLPRLKGIARQAWYANQVRLRSCQPVLRAFASSGIDVLILPPMAVLIEDATAVISPEVPLTCAVRGLEAARAVRWLRGADWRTWVPVPRWSLDGYVLAADRLVWRHVGGQTLDLLWQSDAGDRSGRFPDEVWARAVPAQLSSEPVLALDAADAVHDACRQPVGADAFGRIVDLLFLLDATPATPDWRRFTSRAREAPIAAGWRSLFGDVREVLPLLVPATVVDDWPRTGPRPVPTATTGGMYHRIAAQWSTYRQSLGGAYSLAGALRELPGYLLARWQLPTLGRIPLRVLRGLRYEWRDARRRSPEDGPRR